LTATHGLHPIDFLPEEEALRVREVLQAKTSGARYEVIERHPRDPGLAVAQGVRTGVRVMIYATTRGITYRAVKDNGASGPSLFDGLEAAGPRYAMQARS